jgi:hypothetical protein
LVTCHMGPVVRSYVVILLHVRHPCAHRLHREAELTFETAASSSYNRLAAS